MHWDHFDSDELIKAAQITKIKKFAPSSVRTGVGVGSCVGFDQGKCY